MKKKCKICKEDQILDNFFNHKETGDKKDIYCKKCRKNKSGKYYKNNKETWLEQSHINQAKNKDKIREQHKIYYRKKKKIDPNYKLRVLFSIRILGAIKNKYGYKKSSTLELLGCSVEECRNHLEQQFLPEMTWKNHGIIWEIDHKIPCINFDLTKKEEQKLCFHYTNLQPLFSTTKIAESFGYKNYIGNKNKNKKYER